MCDDKKGRLEQRLTDTHLLERMKAFSVNGSRSLHAKRRSDQWALGIVLRPVNLPFWLLLLRLFDELVYALGHLWFGAVSLRV